MKVTKIEKKAVSKKRVAAYARVSTLYEEQEYSYETQVNYYTQYIKSRRDWKFVKVYTDYGRSGSQANKRPGFLEMIEDVKAHKIDLILVKSISRFARNAKEAQEYVIILKENNTEVFFDRENLSSNDPTAEMIFNMLAAMAQEEIRSISEKVRWTNERFLEQGIRKLGSKHVLGYEEVDGVLRPSKDAWIVKQVFDDIDSGMSINETANHINELGARTLRNEQEFKASDIKRMIQTVIYKGDRHLQQRPPLNYLTHKPDETIKYSSKYIENDHEAIVDREQWERVQAVIKRLDGEHEAGIYHRPNEHFLYGKVVCYDCGLPYVRRTVTCKGEKIKVWKCKDRNRGHKGNGCMNVIVKETDLIQAIMNQLRIEAVDERVLEKIDKIIICPDATIRVVVKQEVSTIDVA